MGRGSACQLRGRKVARRFGVRAGPSAGSRALEEARRRIEAAAASGAGELDLSGLGLTGIPGELYALTDLTRLCLDENELRGLSQETASLSRLAHLSLRQNAIDDAGVKHLASLVNLRSLDLECNQIEAEGAQALAGLVNLRRLNLGGNRIGSEGAQALSALVELEWLDLSGTGIGASGTQVLANLVNLTWLNLDGNGIGREGAEAVGGLSKLVSLSLRGCRIGDEGAAALASLVNLRSLDLRGNLLTGKGVSPLSGLQSLDLRNNRAGRKAVVAPSVQQQGLASVPREMLQAKDAIVRKMIEYPCRQYSEEDAWECGQILQDYLAAVLGAPRPPGAEAVLAAVKDAVLALNRLNALCDGSLIETVEREDICDLIDISAAAAGLEPAGVDITEEWREW